MSRPNLTKRQRAEAMRAAGATYPQITAALGIPKSTLSYWFTGRHARKYVRDSGKCWIYFIQESEAGSPVKIGIARNVDQRLSELQTGNAFQLVIRAKIEGDEHDEMLLHQQFASDRIRGEWFWPSKAMEEVAGTSLGASDPLDERRPGRRPVALRHVPIVVALAQAGRWMRMAEIKLLCSVKVHGTTLTALRSRGWIDRRERIDRDGRRIIEWAYAAHDQPTIHAWRKGELSPDIQQPEAKTA